MNTLTAKELLDSPIRFIGAFGFDHPENGISPRRLPDWTRPQIPMSMEMMVKIPSGVRLAFRTNSSTIRLEALTTYGVLPNRPLPDVGYDLKINGEVTFKQDKNGNRLLIDPQNPMDFKFEQGEVGVTTFSDLGSEEKDVELWLPQNAFVELRKLSLDDGASLDAPTSSGQLKWIHYGSSISHGMNAERPTAIWPAVAAEIGNVELWNMGFGGNCHLDQFVARTIREADADFISIKVGINVVNLDSMRERAFTPALYGFLDTIRERKPDTPILLVSPIYAPGCETDPGPHILGPDDKWIAIPGHDEIKTGCLNLKRIRKIISEVVTIRQQAGDEHIAYLNGLALLNEDDADDLPDDLHPDTNGYRKIGERFAKEVFEKLKSNHSSLKYLFT